MKPIHVLNILLSICVLSFLGNGQEVSYQKLIHDNNQFAIELYYQLASQNGNIFFSPASISTTIAMIYAGARGETAQQIRKALQFSLSDHELHEAFKVFIEKINPKSKEYELIMANALWPHVQYSFQPEYLNLLKINYLADIQALHYTHPEEACKIVNQWVEEKTQGKIRNILTSPPVNTLTRLVLTNAIYFKGQWETQFKKQKTKQEKFFVTHSHQVECPLMNGEMKKVRYFENEFCQALELPYQGGLTMVVLLPKEKGSLANLEKRLTLPMFNMIRDRLDRETVMVFLPKFKITVNISLHEYCKRLGIVDAFMPNQADFSGMDGSKNLFIQAILHKALVDVYEEGTEAAAVTTGIIGITSVALESKTFRADHPFLFFILGINGEILFIGRLTDPTQTENQL